MATWTSPLCWGPLAGYFAKEAHDVLTSFQSRRPPIAFLPQVYDISLGVAAATRR